MIAVLWNSAYSDLMMGQFFRGLHEYQKKHDCKMEFYVQMFENDKLNEMQALPCLFAAIFVSPFLTSFPFRTVGRFHQIHILTESVY